MYIFFLLSLYIMQQEQLEQIGETKTCVVIYI